MPRDYAWVLWELEPEPAAYPAPDALCEACGLAHDVHFDEHTTVAAHVAYACGLLKSGFVPAGGTK